MEEEKVLRITTPEEPEKHDYDSIEPSLHEPCHLIWTALQSENPQSLKKIFKKLNPPQMAQILQNGRDQQQLTLLHSAAIRGFPDLVTYLIEKESDVNPFSRYHWTPLHFAAKLGHEKVVIALLEAGADRELKTSNDPMDNCNNSKTAFEIAQNFNQLSAAKLIKEWAPGTARRGFFKLDHHASSKTREKKRIVNIDLHNDNIKFGGKEENGKELILNRISQLKAEIVELSSTLNKHQVKCSTNNEEILTVLSKIAPDNILNDQKGSWMEIKNELQLVNDKQKELFSKVNQVQSHIRMLERIIILLFVLYFFLL